MLDAIRIDHQVGFILNTRPWRESSLLIDIFTENYGKKTLIARSARKASSTLKGILNPFIPISFSWFGKNNLPTLHQANWIGGYPMPQGLNLLSAWYINELIFKLLPQDDPYPKLFKAVEKTMHSLSEQSNPSIQLRQFEWLLLNELGLAPSVQTDINHQAIQENQFYQVKYESNLIPINPKYTYSEEIIISGYTLTGIHKNDYIKEKTKKEARLFFQFLLEQHIHKNQIISSQILKQLFQTTFESKLSTLCYN